MARVWTAVLLLGTCLLYCARVAMPICAVSMAEKFHWSKRESGMVLGSFFWGYCFTQVFGGYVSDRWETFEIRRRHYADVYCDVNADSDTSLWVATC